MAMTSCGECGHEISTTARSCPNCGAVVPRPKKWPWIVGIPFALFMAVVLYGLTIPEYRTRAREVREACEKMASPLDRPECDRIYERLIAEGKAQEGR